MSVDTSYKIHDGEVNIPDFGSVSIQNYHHALRVMEYQPDLLNPDGDDMTPNQMLVQAITLINSGYRISNRALEMDFLPDTNDETEEI